MGTNSQGGERGRCLGEAARLTSVKPEEIAIVLRQGHVVVTMGTNRAGMPPELKQQIEAYLQTLPLAKRWAARIFLAILEPRVSALFLLFILLLIIALGLEGAREIGCYRGI